MKHANWLRLFALAYCLAFVVATVAAPQQGGRGGKRGGGADLPLEAASTISFTTDEGTWISLDVDPDGETIVFELLGDLYELPIAGGEATRITSGMAYDSQPKISPDGEWIAFVSDRGGNNNLWIAARDGSDPRKLSSGKQGGVISPSWTPDSKYVMVTQTGGRGAQVRMYHIDGGSGITVGGGSGNTGTGAPEAPGRGGGSPTRLGVQMSPDGNYLYFAQAAGGGGGGGGIARWQIARMDMRGGEVDVTGVESYGLFITGTELPAEGFVHISALSDDYYKYDRAGHVIKGFRSGNTYRLGDPVRVEVVTVDVDRRELDFRLLGKSGKAARKLAPSRGVSKKGPTKKGKSRKDARGKKKGSKRKRR